MAYEFYCNAATGSNANSGSTEAAPVYSSTNGAWDSTTKTFTPTSGDPRTTVSVGMWMSVFTDGGTKTQFVGQVSSVTATTIVCATVTFGTNPTTAANGISCIVGGPWLGPNGAEGFPFNWIGTINSTLTNVNFKSGTVYSVTAAITHNQSHIGTISGYTTTIRDGGQAIIDGGTSGTSYALLTFAGGIPPDLGNFEIRNNGATGSADGVTTSVRQNVFNLKIHNIRGNGLVTLVSGANAGFCEIYSCNTSNTSGKAAVSVGSPIYDCYIHDNSGSNNDGILVTQAGVLISRCAVARNGRNGIFNNGQRSVSIDGCDITGNTTGVNDTATSCIISNSNFTKNTTGIAGTRCMAINCGFGTGTSVNTTKTSGTVYELGSFNYPTDIVPWKDPDNGNFQLTASAGKKTGKGIPPAATVDVGSVCSTGGVFILE